MCAHMQCALYSSVLDNDSSWCFILFTDYLLFYVPLRNFSLVWRRHHYQWRAAKFRPMLGAHSLWAGRDLYRATSTVTQDLGFSGLIRMTAPFHRLLRNIKGCGEPILTRTLTGLFCFRISYCILDNWKFLLFYFRMSHLELRWIEYIPGRRVKFRHVFTPRRDIQRSLQERSS
jgi:hypothetical protein